MKLKLVGLLLALVAGGCGDIPYSECKSRVIPTYVPPEGWRSVSERNISFSIPETMKKVDFEPLDSFVFEYSNQSLTLIAEQGAHAPPISDIKNDPKYAELKEKNVELRANRAFQIDFRIAGAVADAYYGDKKLGKVVEIICNSQNERVLFFIRFSDRQYDETAEKIIESVAVRCNWKGLRDPRTVTCPD